jgi:D-alanyl-D-alanine carboxypeptidase
MSFGLLSPSHRVLVGALLATFIAATISCDHAQARARNHKKHHASHRVIHGPDYRPPYAAIVVDANSGEVLHEASPDEPRHPASLTKIMTLYMLFEQIDAGKLKLDTPLHVSAEAAMQPPTKLGLKSNQMLTVEDAIKGMVTRSANDAARVVGEAIGGTEQEFATLMTEKAKALGMANTTYVNASGLPADEQITTARDQAILGRSIQDRFPELFRYFSTLNFRYHGVDIHNHNSLLGHVRGVDGIKTGYTDASGYNLVTSVRREGRHIVAVVLGGRSNAARDTRMRELIEEHIGRASTGRTAPATTEVAREEGAPVAIAPVPVPAPRPQATPGEAAENALASAKTELVEDTKPVANSRARSGRSRHAAKQSSDAAQRARAGTTFNGFNFFSVR